MSRLVLVLLIVGAALAACGTAPLPSPMPSGAATSPPPAGTAAPPSPEPSPEPSPASPRPTGRPSAATPAPVVTPEPSDPPAGVEPTVEEAYLIAGVRGDLTGCRPLRENLPRHATGGIECVSDDPTVARVGFFLFDGTADMLAAYFARMDAEGVERDSGACDDGEGESPYIPGEDEIDSRHGCFVNDEGYANWRGTVPGNLLYIGVLGRTSDMRSLVDFAWRGNADTPGMPTLWIEPGE